MTYKTKLDLSNVSESMREDSHSLQNKLKTSRRRIKNEEININGFLNLFFQFCNSVNRNTTE